MAASISGWRCRSIASGLPRLLARPAARALMRLSPHAGGTIAGAAAALAVALPALAAIPSRAAPGSDVSALGFVNLFHDSCMVYLGQDQALNATLERNGFKILPVDASTDYLQGSTGIAWAAPRSLGELVVALRDDGTCAVFARRVHQAQVQSAFDGLARASASPVLPVIRQPDRVVDAPSGPANYRSYLQGKPSSGSAIQLTLSTTSSAAARYQAIATLSLVERPADPPSPAQP